MKKTYNIIKDEQYGYYRLDPLPDDDELDVFYRSEYYDLITQGGRAPELRRLMSGGEEAQRELAWLRSTLYDDIWSVIKEHGNGQSILDVGCGPGELLFFLREKGFDVTGVEPSKEAAAVAESRGIKIYNATLEQFLNNNVDTAFHAVIMLNVLEHVPNPRVVIEQCKIILDPEGLLCIRVPNDFSSIQLTAQAKLSRQTWWIAAPDHINYFNFQSLHQMMGGLGFDIVYVQGDFPMELFLLMGDDYVNNPEIGSQCHRKRIALETSLSGEQRRQLYQAMAAAGIGRNCLVFCRPR